MGRKKTKKKTYRGKSLLTSLKLHAGSTGGERRGPARLEGKGREKGGPALLRKGRGGNSSPQKGRGGEVFTGTPCGLITGSWRGLRTALWGSEEEREKGVSVEACDSKEEGAWTVKKEESLL